MEKPPFFRSYRAKLSGGTIRAEFDGGFLSSASSAYNAHNHAAAELIAVSEGVSEVDIIEHGVFRCQSGDVLLIPEGLYHANRRAQQTYDRFCLRFIFPPAQRGISDGSWK